MVSEVLIRPDVHDFVHIAYFGGEVADLKARTSRSLPG